jgi:hypothetical protein
MRRISFALTEPQLLDLTKTVTRRSGWAELPVGSRLLAVRKAMGLKKGEQQTKLAVIEALDVRAERLDAITQADVIAEGFPTWTCRDFVEFYCRGQRTPDGKRVTGETVITRIEFRVREFLVGGTRIIIGDAFDFMRQHDPREFAVLVVDPPYGENYSSNRAGKFKGKAIAGDSSMKLRDAMIDWWAPGRALKGWTVEHPLALWQPWDHQWLGGAPLPKPVRELVWDKGMGVGMGDLSVPWKDNHEKVLIYGRGWSGFRGPSVTQAIVPSWSDASGNMNHAHRVRRCHPNEKPVSYLQTIIEKAPPGRVLDLCAGGCSTAVAAHRAGREATVVDIDPTWLVDGRERVASEALQVRLGIPLGAQLELAGAS